MKAYNILLKKTVTQVQEFTVWVQDDEDSYHAERLAREKILPEAAKHMENVTPNVHYRLGSAYVNRNATEREAVQGTAGEVRDIVHPADGE